MRATRIIIGIMVPAPLGAVFLNLMFLALNFSSSSGVRMYASVMDFIETILGTVFFAYIFIGVQSVIYSLLMEFVINPYIKNNYWVVFVSTLLGIISGVVFPLSIIAGGFTGMTLGFILRGSYLVEQDEIKR